MEEKQRRKKSLKAYILVLSLLPICILGTEVIALLFIYLKGKIDNSLYRTVVIQMAIFVVVTLIITAVVVVILVSRMIATLLRLSDILNAVSDGDLTQEIAQKDLEHNNELGVIARSTALLNDKLKSLVSGISGTTEMLKESAADMERIADSTAQAADHVTTNMEEITTELTNQSGQTENVASDVFQIGKMIEQSTKAVDSLRNDMEAMQLSGKEGMKTVVQLETVDEDVRARMEVIARQTNTTNSSAQEIQAATELIASIAEETNLLALNASIEAARAGDQGRGFAVVADQIQKLAEQSNQSAATIDQIVQHLLSDAGNAVTTMEEIQGSIKQQNETVAAVKEVFSKVSEGIMRSARAIEEIADSTRYLNDSKENLITASEQLNTISQNSLAVTEETNAEAQELDSSVAIINESTVKLKDSAEELARQMEYFKK